MKTRDGSREKEGRESDVTAGREKMRGKLTRGRGKAGVKEARRTSWKGNQEKKETEKYARKNGRSRREEEKYAKEE